jgi:methylated-DNA-[protein]-cysteine S-methyltransferase
VNYIEIQYYSTTYGELVLGTYENQLCLCDWRYRKMRNSLDERLLNGLNAEFIEQDNTVLQNTKYQLEEYFLFKRKRFEIPLLTIGTDFQKKVWNELLNIDYGKTVSYLNLAEKLGNKEAVRAVAAANGANAISIIIPCHRVIGSNGELTGYAGGLRAKEKLLSLEQNQTQQKMEFI